MHIHILFLFGNTTLEVITMFSQRRKKYRNLVWASVLTAIALLSLVLLLGYLGSFKEEPYQETPANETVSVTDETEAKETKPDEITKTKDEATRSQQEIKKQTYYLLKYDNDIVRIFFSDQQGNLTELEETNIVYETLSPEDQRQLLDGIQAENREALNRILMDYES